MENKKIISPNELSKLAEISTALEQQCLNSWGLRRIVGGYVWVSVNLEDYENTIYFTVISGVQSDVQNSRDEEELQLSRIDFDRYRNREISKAEAVNLIN